MAHIKVIYGFFYLTHIHNNMYESKLQAITKIINIHIPSDSTFFETNLNPDLGTYFSP